MLLFLSVCFACNFIGGKETVISQNSVDNKEGNKAEPEDERFLGKAFILDSGREKLIEFKGKIDENGKESFIVYLDEVNKAALSDVANPQILADFYDGLNGRVFVIAVKSPASGNCGNSSFGIVKINEKTGEVKISKPSDVKCEGEIQDIGIETQRAKQTIYRNIKINNLRFNLEKFEWTAKK